TPPEEEEIAVVSALSVRIRSISFPPMRSSPARGLGKAGRRLDEIRCERVRFPKSLGSSTDDGVRTSRDRALCALAVERLLGEEPVEQSRGHARIELRITSATRAAGETSGVSLRGSALIGPAHEDFTQRQGAPARIAAPRDRGISDT